MKQKAERSQNEPSSILECSEIRKFLPQDLLSHVTVMYQGSGYITISPHELSGLDWPRMNKQVKRIGGIWISNKNRSHWSIPLTKILESCSQDNHPSEKNCF